MNILDAHTINTLDSQHMLSSIEVLEKQCLEAWNATTTAELPPTYTDAHRMVWLGMGGSALGIDVVKNLYSNEIPVPIEIVNGYAAPATVNEHTLVVLSSYSGTTEEVIEAAKDVLKKTKMVYIVTTGGDLEQLAKDHNLPAYIFEPTFNPSNQPRMAIGYSVMATIGLFHTLRWITVTQQDVEQMTSHLTSLHKQYGADVPDNTNLAKQLATQMHEHISVIVSSEFLDGSAHVMANQTNENSKQCTIRFQIPEMDHFLLEGLQYPETKNLFFIFFTSGLYHKRNQLRHTITHDMVTQKGLPATQIALQGNTALEQAFELILLGGYTSLYAAILNDIDPSPIPTVDYFKDELKKA